MKKYYLRCQLILLAVSSVAVITFLSMIKKSMPDDELNILFTRLYRLNANSPLLDPTNTETVAEYYLLENLTTGLIRDSNLDVRGYEPGIAERWWHPNPNSWIFKIRNNLKWSDGKPITLNEIKSSLSNLKTSRSRHILYMRNIEEILTDFNTNEITLTFSTPVNAGVLHELSLADSGLLHVNNLKNDWSVTSGPYTISDFNRELSEAHLTINKFCPLIKKNSYKKLRLFYPEDYKKLLTIPNEISYDLFALPSYQFRVNPQIMIKNAQQVKISAPNLIYFFAFNPNNSQKNDLRTRIRFAEAFQKHPIQLPPGTSKNDQLIPLGFAGHLANFSLNVSSTSSPMQNINIKLLLPSLLRDSTALLTSIRKSLKQSSITAEITFDDVQKYDSSVFATLYAFKGNQRDPFGSWVFLFSEISGPLGYFRKNVGTLFNKIMVEQNEQAREQLLSTLHKMTLEEVYAAPIAIETSIVLHSNRVNLDKWNSFDLRTRYYEIE